MANFVKSTEKVSTTFTAAGTNTVNLSKSQDETKCVPKYTMRFTATQTDARGAYSCRIEMIDNAGTPAARVSWTPGGATIGDITVIIFVKEYGSNVTIQQGSTSLTGGSATATITAVTQGNAYVVFNQDATAADTGDDWDDHCVRAAFSLDTEITFDRRAAGGPDWDIEWYVIESDGTDFTTEYISDEAVTGEKGPKDYTVTALTLAKAYIIVNYKNTETGDDLKDGHCNFALTSTTALTFYRDHGATPGATVDFGVWIVKTSGTEFSVERFATDCDAATTTTQAITSIDQARAILVSSSHNAFGTWPIDSSVDGADNEKHMSSLDITGDTEVSIIRRADTAIGGSENKVRYEVVEFALIAAAAEIPSLTVAPYIPA